MRKLGLDMRDTVRWKFVDLFSFLAVNHITLSKKIGLLNFFWGSQSLETPKVG